MSTAATTTTTTRDDDFYQLRLSSGNGPVTRHVRKTSIRDALSSEVPIIDVSGIFSSCLADREAVAAKVHHAATTNGFFYITNHSIPTKVIDNAYDSCLDFFRQPLSAKNEANINGSRYFNGYKPPQTQRINPNESVDHREGFSWTYSPLHDTTLSEESRTNIPPHISRYLRHDANDFPWSCTTSTPTFKPSILAYYQSCLYLARALVRTFALSLSLPESHFDSKFTYPDAALALNYYPPLPSTRASSDVSIGSHTDFQLFTILYQPPSIRALQVLTPPPQSQWLHAPGIEGTLVVNIADYFQRITNDLYTSTVHRAVNVSGEERVSMPFFFGFGLHESCGVLPSCVSGERPARYGEISCEEWVMRRARAMHDTRGVGEEMADGEAVV